MQLCVLETMTPEVWMPGPLVRSHHILLFKVDAHKMEAFINHFVENLGLDAAYTMIVINPTWTPNEPFYGYRKVGQRRREGL